jgi:pyrroloquinoline quinone biosynthesis protein B
MRVKVLGSAAGGGFPQWNCGCLNCSRFRIGKLKGRARTQTQVAISPSKPEWFLLNASPDLRQQLLQNPEFSPQNGIRSTPIQAIILTSADVDCVMGLLHLREFQPLRIFATRSVHRVLTEENSLFRALDRSSPSVQWLPLPLNEPVSISEESAGHGSPISCRAASVGGNFPDYVSPGLRSQLCAKEAVIALEITQNDKCLFFGASLPQLSSDVKDRLNASDAAFLDGTFWSDSELADVTGNGRTAREIGHLPLSGKSGLLEQINNTNPLLDEESAANRSVRDARWEIAYDGMDFEL